MKQNEGTAKVTLPTNKKTKANGEPIITPNGIDFETLSREHGYVNARHMLKQTAIRTHQDKIKVVESALNASKKPLRMKEAVHLGNTYGSIPNDSVLERIMKGNQGVFMSEATQLEILERVMEGKASLSKMLGPSSGSGPSKKSVASKKASGSAGLGMNEKQAGDAEAGADVVVDKMLQSQSKTITAASVESYLPPATEPDHRFEQEEALRYAMESPGGDLLIANQDVSNLPIGLGDTLNLQVCFVRRLICTRNLMRTIISDAVPQLSLYHLRYLSEINLSFNKLGRLPADFGVLTALESLNLSHNFLSTLPPSIKELKKLKVCNLSHNNFAKLPDDFAQLDALQQLDLSDNLFTIFPYVVVRLHSLKHLSLNRNSLLHLAVLPMLLHPEDMWTKVIDNFSGEYIFMNVLTRERVKKMEFYNGAGIKRRQELHTFQHEDSKWYHRRKIWLSICQIPEWEPTTDPESGLMYFRNNVSGTTTWEMPASLDTLGRLSALEEFVVKNNSIKSFPLSFIAIRTVRKIVMTTNRINSLPEEIGTMQSLEHLELTSNELRVLPVSLCDCASLHTLLLGDNQLLRLPEKLGRMKQLKKLDVSANHLKTIPFSLGYCETLESLNVSENPIVDPPMPEFEKGIVSVKWYLRSRFLIDEHGMPPQMEFHPIGIANEVEVAEPEFTAIVRQMIEASRKDGLLNLQLLGIREIPPDVLKMKHLRRLKLDFNNRLELSEGFPEQLKALTKLTMRGCRMAVLPENVHIFERINTLHVHENCFESIPEGINEVRTLTSLDLSKNRIYAFPNGFEKLKKLKSLNLEANNLEYIPPELCALRSLRTLNLSKNRLVDYPDSMCDLLELKVLNLEKNCLQLLPFRMRDLCLVELRVGHNILERLDNELFSAALGASIKVFSCCENNLLELPSSITEIDVEALVEADFNPFISPPPYLLSEGLKIVQQYMLIRRTRRALFEELMADEDFVLTPDSFSPIAVEVLADGTGFLSPDDLADFDQAVDEFTNAEYFRCPATAQEIVDSITQLRDYRETELYLTILYTFLGVVARLRGVAEGTVRTGVASSKTVLGDNGDGDDDNEGGARGKDPRFSEAVLTEEERPWGRRGEKVKVWVVSLFALLRDTPPNALLPEGRPSLFSLIEAALPPIPFPFTVDLLKDALRLYQSPYDKIGDTEQIEFPACDCVDDVRGKPRRHNPCRKAAVVLAKSIYVEEEAERREVEEDEFLEAFQEIDDDVRIWLQTEEGKNNQDREIRRRKALLKEEIQLREEMVTVQQLKVKKANDTIKGVTKRKTAFEAGEAFETHGFRDVGEAVKLLTEAEAELQLYTARTEVLKETARSLKEQLRLGYDVYMAKTADDIVQKYCVQHYNVAVEKYRYFALKHKLRRHWDGEDGAAYAAWKRLHDYAGSTDHIGDEIPETDERPQMGGKSGKVLQRTDSMGSKDSAATGGSGKGGGGGADKELTPEYDFQDTLDTKPYDVYIYHRYVREKGNALFSI